MSKLTDKQVADVERELNALRVKVETQCAEQCVFLVKQIKTDTTINIEMRNRLVQIVEGGGFKVKVFRITDKNVMQTPHVQVAYDIDDELFAYLKRPDNVLPKRLHGFLEGGIDITKEASTPLAQDPTPQTGKTKTGVPEYDAILAQRKGN